MTDPELGAFPIPEDPVAAESMGRALLPCTVAGHLAAFVAPVENAVMEVKLRRVGNFHKGRDTVNRFCRTNPLDWCAEQFAEGKCARSIQWWQKRVAQTILAVECGCDPATCPICHRVGAPPAACGGCRLTTGWEAEHLPELEALREMFDAT